MVSSGQGHYSAVRNRVKSASLRADTKLRAGRRLQLGKAARQAAPGLASKEARQAGKQAAHPQGLCVTRLCLHGALWERESRPAPLIHTLCCCVLRCDLVVEQTRAARRSRRREGGGVEKRTGRKQSGSYYRRRELVVRFVIASSDLIFK